MGGARLGREPAIWPALHLCYWPVQIETFFFIFYITFHLKVLSLHDCIHYTFSYMYRIYVFLLCHTITAICLPSSHPLISPKSLHFIYPICKGKGPLAFQE